MTKRTNSKHKVDRRLRVNLWGRPKSPFNSRNYPPGQHGKAKKGKLSDYGTQLEAKQKMKFYYGNMNERQFRNVYRKAIQKKGNTSENLIGFLERRLDTVAYRAKFATTVFSARQLINHGHIKVNSKKVNISSYLVKEKDTIEIKDKSKELKSIKKSLRRLINDARGNDFQLFEFLDANLSVMAAAHQNILSNAKKEKKLIIRVQKSRKINIIQ